MHRHKNVFNMPVKKVKVKKGINKGMKHKIDIKRAAGEVVLFLIMALIFINVIGTLVLLEKIFYEKEGKLPVVSRPLAETLREEDGRVLIRKIIVQASAYSSSADQTDSTPCITANGFNLCTAYYSNGIADTIAANFLPMNSVVRIPDLFGDRLFVVRDRMNPRYSRNHIDIWMPTRNQAVAFGRRWVEVEIVR